MDMRYTGIIVPDTEAHAAFVQFTTEDDGSIELRAFAEAHPDTTPVMYVGEPGDPDDSARWIVTVNETGDTSWRVPAAGEDIFA
jgi:hypothetical protein